MKPEPRVLSGAETAWLLHGSPSAVLARIVPDDPLGLRARVAQRLELGALLCDLDQALLRVQAAVALGARAWHGEPQLADWLEQRIEEGLREGLVAPLDEGRAAGAVDTAPTRPCAPPGFEGRELEAACRRFNRLPLESRRAFFALVLEGTSPDAFARAQALALGELARRVRAALAPFRGLGAAGARLRAKELEPVLPPPAERSA